jgi:hypothetical protein
MIFELYHRRSILVHISLPIHSLSRKIPHGSAAKNEDKNYSKITPVSIFFTGTTLLVFDIFPHELKFHQNRFLAMTARELSKSNANIKRRVGKNQLVVRMDNSMHQNERKIQKHFAWKITMRVLHPVCSFDLSRCDSGSTKKRTKDDIITNEDDLNNKLTEVWEIVCKDLLESVFYEWMSRLERVIQTRGNIVSIHIGSAGLAAIVP